MSEKKILSFDEAYEADGTEYDTVPYGKGLLQIGTVSSADMIEWMEENEDPAKRKEAGLRLLVKSIVNAEKQRIPESQREAALKKFAGKDARMNGTVIKRILELNGMAKKAAEIAKNESGEAPTAASPTGSPSPQAR